MLFVRPLRRSPVRLSLALALVYLSVLLFSPTSASSELDSTIVVLGDSISAAYGLPEDAGWVALLQDKLRQNHYQFNIINASITGETTSGGANRAGPLFERHKPQIVILELGGNDGLRGLSLKSMRQNLEKIIQHSKEIGAQVLLLGMQIPPNYGAQYANRFHQIYHQLAEQYALAFVPFFLEQVALNPALMQRDGIHPGAAAQPIMLDAVWSTIARMLDQ